MIKTDYKPESSVKAIFSSSRKRTAMPVIVMAVAVVALSLAVWGLWVELDETTTTDIVTDHLITGETTPSNEPSQQLKRQELQLEFEHDENSSNPENSQDNALKRNSQINKNTTTNKVNNNQELADTSISSQYTWNKTKIRSGDSMARVFKRLGFKPGDLHAIISLGKNTAILKKIKPGKMLEYSTQSNGELNAIRYEIDPLNTLVVIKTNDRWQETIETKKLD